MILKLSFRVSYLPGTRGRGALYKNGGYQWQAQSRALRWDFSREAQCCSLDLCKSLEPEVQNTLNLMFISFLTRYLTFILQTINYQQNLVTFTVKFVFYEKFSVKLYYLIIWGEKGHEWMADPFLPPYFFSSLLFILSSFLPFLANQAVSLKRWYSL